MRFSIGRHASRCLNLSLRLGFASWYAFMAGKSLSDKFSWHSETAVPSMSYDSKTSTLGERFGTCSSTGYLTATPPRMRHKFMTAPVMVSTEVTCRLPSSMRIVPVGQRTLEFSRYDGDGRKHAFATIATSFFATEMHSFNSKPQIDKDKGLSINQHRFSGQHKPRPIEATLARHRKKIHDVLSIIYNL